jgi:asparagine N-glycosylation enzyme membrane subunit Stt3
MPETRENQLRRIRLILAVFVVALVLSGVTAFPLVHELRILDAWVSPGSSIGEALPGLAAWIARVREGLEHNAAHYPFIAYGSDWLAFAHLVIAAAFLGPWKDPVRNIWVIDWALIACAGVIPLALIAGPLRGIPVYWRLIDCSFGVFGCIPLLLLRREIKRLERMPS